MRQLLRPSAGENKNAGSARPMNILYNIIYIYIYMAQLFFGRYEATKRVYVFHTCFIPFGFNPVSDPCFIPLVDNSVSYPVSYPCQTPFPTPVSHLLSTTLFDSMRWLVGSMCAPRQGKRLGSYSIARRWPYLFLVGASRSRELFQHASRAGFCSRRCAVSRFSRAAEQASQPAVPFHTRFKPVSYPVAYPRPP
jgi:hypothetical protein